MNIVDYLSTSFKLSNYVSFVGEFFNGIKKVPYKDIKPHASFSSSIDSYAVNGVYKDIDGNEIIVLSVKIKNNNKARQSQRNFVAHLLTNEFNRYSAALVAFYGDEIENWKLSFVTVEMGISSKGIELKFKPAKRYSFLVGINEPTKTYVQQLNPIYKSNIKPTLAEISDAFSVVRLSNDFFEDYKRKFFELVDYLQEDKVFVKEAKRLGFPETDKFAVTFAKKTLGQMVFLHFIQKKGWLGVNSVWGDGDQKYIINSTNSYDGKNYFNDYLEPLFYNALNFHRDNDIYLGKKIPFLNGGLFQPVENYDWENTDFHIPDDYWFNSNDNGLLNILSQYNFTVDESNPYEQEVAVDPEMLGRIFEKLLDVKDRSSLGAFYTPREIVHFMCEEALAERISTLTGIEQNSMINYIRYGDALKETEFIESFADEIDEIISNITIVDPAVGSGAFLVGMLNQIVSLRTNINSFTKKNISNYEMKLQAIQKTLYGVDVEYDAIEIAKLRLWLSLIVDQDTSYEPPKPLPNLSFCLRVGNSLVDTFENIKLWNSRWRGSKKDIKSAKSNQANLFNVDTVNGILERLKKAKVKFFCSSDENEKNELLRYIERQQMELIRSELVAKEKFAIYDSIEEMIEKETKPFFIWELEFEEVFENGGFDIVIANPPYVQLQKDGGKLANQLKDQGYETFIRSGDIYCLFYEKAIALLKESGVAVYITSNKWMRAKYGEKIRKFLADNTNPIMLIDFGGTKVFESATVDVNILMYKNENNNHNTSTCKIGNDFNNELSDYIKHNLGKKSFKESKSWIILNKIENNIKDKIDIRGTKIKDLDIQINYGVKTGFNKAFIIDEKTKEELILKDSNSSELIQPIIRGRDIKKYTYHFAKKYMICTFPSKNVDISKYPAINNHLLSFDKRRLEQSGKKNIDGIKGYNSRKKTGNKWFETQDQINYWDDFNKRKIVYPETTQGAFFSLDENGIVLDKTCFMLISSYPEYLLATLSSKLFEFAYKKLYSSIELGENGYQYNKHALVKLPIINPDIIKNKDYDYLVSLIIEISNGNSNTNTIQKKINDIIYMLYNISTEEIDYINNIK